MEKELTTVEKIEIERIEAERAKKRRTARKEALRTLKYFIVAGSAGGIQMGTYALFLEVFHWTHWLAYLISLTLSVLWNFTINRKFTFKSANNVPVAMFKVICYYAVFAPLSTFWTKEFNAMASPENKAAVAYGVEVATLLFNGITEFLYQRFFVFGKSVDSAGAKVTKGETGQFGEVFIEKEALSGAELNEMMRQGIDISALKERDIKRWRKEN